MVTRSSFFCPPRTTSTVLITLSVLISCADPSALKPIPQPELEGPRGQVTSPGPWLIKAFLPRAPSEAQVELEQEVAPGAWETLEPPRLTQSPQVSLWLGTLPTLSEGRALRYRLLDEANGAPSLSPPWRSVLYLSADSRSVAAPVCTVSLIEPRPDQVLNDRSDVGQAAGLQYKFVAGLRGAEETSDEQPSAIKLTVNLAGAHERAYMSLSEGGRAVFSSVTLTAGQQQARVEGFTSQGAYCQRQVTLHVD